MGFFSRLYDSAKDVVEHPFRNPGRTAAVIGAGAIVIGATVLTGGADIPVLAAGAEAIEAAAAAAEAGEIAPLLGEAGEAAGAVAEAGEAAEAAEAGAEAAEVGMEAGEAAEIDTEEFMRRMEALGDNPTAEQIEEVIEGLSQEAKEGIVQLGQDFSEVLDSISEAAQDVDPFSDLSEAAQNAIREHFGMAEGESISQALVRNLTETFLPQEGESFYSPKYLFRAIKGFGKAYDATTMMRNMKTQYNQAGGGSTGVAAALVYAFSQYMADQGFQQVVQNDVAQEITRWVTYRSSNVISDHNKIWGEIKENSPPSAPVVKTKVSKQLERTIIATQYESGEKIQQEFQKKGYASIKYRKDLSPLPEVRTFYDRKTNHYYIAHLGTRFKGPMGLDTPIDDVLSDKAILTNKEESDKQFIQRTQATESIIRRIKNVDPNAKITLSGHSLGGSTVNYAMKKNKYIFDNVDNAEMFNAGASPTKILNQDSDNVLDPKWAQKMTFHTVKGDMISQFSFQYAGKHVYYAVKGNNKHTIDNFVSPENGFEDDYTGGYDYSYGTDPGDSQGSEIDYSKYSNEELDSMIRAYEEEQAERLRQRSRQDYEYETGYETGGYVIDVPSQYKRARYS